MDPRIHIFTLSSDYFPEYSEKCTRMSAISDIQHNQQTKLSMLRCRLASDLSEIVKNMSYRVRQQTSRPF